MAERSQAGAVYVPLTAQAGRWLRSGDRVPRPPTYDELLTRLRRLPTQVISNWDSYGGRQVPQEACDRVVAFITTLLAHLEDHPPAPEVGPVPEGGVILRWRTHDYDVEPRGGRRVGCSEARDR
jgi:hypothetical protein